MAWIRWAAAMLLACVLAPTAALAQGSGDKSPMRLVIGVPPGGSLDTAARILAELLPARLNRTVIVENRPGANQVIATKQVVASRGKLDMLLMGSSGPIVTNPIFFANERVDPLQDLVPLSLVAASQFVVLVRSDSPHKTIGDFIARARSNPGGLTYSYGTTSFRIAAEMFMSAAGVELRAIPYNGAGPALNSVMAGDVDMSILDVSSSSALIKGGKLRPLMVLSTERDPQIPDVPSASDAGLKDLDVSTWSAVLAPAGVPEEELKAVERAIVEILSDPATKERMERAGLTRATIGPAALRARIVQDRDRSAEVIRRAKLTIN